MYIMGQSAKSSLASVVLLQSSARTRIRLCNRGLQE